MVPKRKVTDEVVVPANKRSRIGDTHDSPLDQDSFSDDVDDYKVNYTDNGTKRADSEARRQWNYVCTVSGCGERFNRPCRLEAHMRSHNKERPFACSEPGCDKTFPRKDHLQRHLKNSHSDPVVERTYSCDWEGCSKSFTSNGRLQRHREVHDSKFYCTAFPPCKESFRKETTLEAHIKTQHEQIKPYPCTFIDPETNEKCTSGYQTESSLLRHVSRKHTSEKQTELFCMICAQPSTDEGPALSQTDGLVNMSVAPPVFATQEELQAHVAENHPPVCNQCGQQFKNDSNLKSHLDTVHADPALQPRFSCPKPDCNSVFNRKHNLAIHVQTVHENKARFFCTSDALRTSKHEDLKNWTGENACGAAFKAKSSLDQHVRTHHLFLGNRKQLRKQHRKATKSKKKPEASMLSMLTGVGYEENRDIPCLVKTCEYRFYRDCDLRRHLRAEHNMAVDEIEEMITERDALTGGQFWIGGLDDSMDMFDSVTPSMPQTPAPYFVDGGMPFAAGDAQSKGLDQHFDFFEQPFDMLQEEEEMDLAMGLGDLAPAQDIQEGLQWDMGLAPVGQYNMEHE